MCVCADGKTSEPNRASEQILWLTRWVCAEIEASGVLLRGSQQDKAPPQGTTQGVTVKADRHLSF